MKVIDNIDTIRNLLVEANDILSQFYEASNDGQIGMQAEHIEELSELTERIKNKIDYATYLD